MECGRKVQDVLACSFSNWYPLFEKVTMKSVWVPVPAEVAAYIQSDGTLVSNEVTTADTNTDDEEDSVDWEAAQEDAPELQRPEFAAFDAEVCAAMEAVGGAAFVKLNWSAPVDVRWLSVGRALRCQTPDDVHLLLRSSSRLQHDLCTPFEGCADAAAGAASADLQLVVRRWEDVSPAAEFRCFVVEGHLIAISQREISQYFPHLERDASSIVTDITSFFKENIQAKFPLQNYAFDVYRSAKDFVRLLDFSPLGPPAEPGLFTWDQLSGKHCLRCEDVPSRDSPLCADCVADGGTVPVFQYIAGADSIQRAPYADAELPYDVHHLAETGGTSAIIRLLQKSQNRGKSDQSTDDEEG